MQKKFIVNQTSESIVKSTNLELLRIVSMLMVVTLHFLGRSGVLDSVKFGSMNYFILWFIESLSYVSVNCYVLLSGYLLVNSSFKKRRIIAIISQVMFYSIFFMILINLLQPHKYSLVSSIKYLAPISGNIYWYATLYVLLLVISPILNIVLTNISKKNFDIMLISMFFVFTVIPTIVIYVDGFSINNGYSLIWFLCLYIYGAYVKLHINIKMKNVSLFMIYIIISVLLTMSHFIISIVTKEVLGYVLGETVLFRYNTVLIFFASIAFFLVFIYTDIRSRLLNKIIIRLSNGSFGVYLVHEHPYVRVFLWENVFLSGQYANNYMIYARLFLIVLFIYILGIVFEKTRLFIFYKIGSTEFVIKTVGTISSIGVRIVEKIVKKLELNDIS